VRIIWTNDALRDLSAARAYIAANNPAAAAQQILRVVNAVGLLSQFPQSGRPGRRAGTRELVVNRTPYMLPYRIGFDTIEILRVLHGRQRWPDHL
jgi:toxin ParE1/3/4